MQLTPKLKKMKILIVSPYLGCNYGGTSKSIIEQFQTLGKLDNITLDLVTTNANVYEKLNIPINIWLIEKFYRVQYFHCWNRHDFIISPSLVNWLFKHIADYDLVHTNTVFAPLISLTNWICRFYKIPYIITPHGMLEPWALSYKAWKKQFYYNLIEKPALQKAKTIHVLTNNEANSIKSLGFENTVVIPNGIHRQEFEILPDANIFYQQFPTTLNKSLILFLSRIDPKKGLDLLATAFTKVHHQFPDTHLVIAGLDSIDFLPVVKRYFAQAGCLDNVTFTGMLTGSLKLAALAAASCYVLPSYSEGFSMSVLEGMASGLPCVITTGCNFPEAANNNIAHVVNVNANAIADALIQCFSQPQAAVAMGTRARTFVFQNYTWESSAQGLIQVYKRIINNKSLSLSFEAIRHDEWKHNH